MPIDIEFEKHVEYNLRKKIVDRNPANRKLLRGCFREKGSKKLHKGDEFLAYELSKCSALEVYECYISWFNGTLRPFEKPRIAVSAKWIKSV
jgi:hypothetical protein